MSDASALPVEVRESAARSISAADLPAAIERQAAAGGVGHVPEVGTKGGG